MPLSDKITDALKGAFEALGNKLEKEKEEAEQSVQTNSATNYLDSLGNISDFANKYRDALGVQRDLTFQNLEQSRRNAYQNIMGAANTAGMMYSNFPERSKIQYDTNTYMPARTKAQSTYQTGLDTLRSNVTNYLNTLADYNDEIASLNKQYTASGSSGVLNDAGDKSKYSLTEDRTWFYNANGDPIRFGTTVSRSGTPSTNYILDAAETALDENAVNWLENIYKKARSNGYSNIVVNAGESFAPNSLNFLSDAERDFMDSLGLTFAQ